MLNAQVDATQPASSLCAYGVIHMAVATRRDTPSAERNNRKRSEIIAKFRHACAVLRLTNQASTNPWAPMALLKSIPPTAAKPCFSIHAAGWQVGGADEDRTHDLRIANTALSQLSYRPT